MVGDAGDEGAGEALLAAIGGEVEGDGDAHVGRHDGAAERHGGGDAAIGLPRLAGERAAQGHDLGLERADPAGQALHAGQIEVDGAEIAGKIGGDEPHRARLRGIAGVGGEAGERVGGLARSQRDLIETDPAHGSKADFSRLRIDASSRAGSMPNAFAIIPSLTTTSTLRGWTSIEPLTPVPFSVARFPDHADVTPYLPTMSSNSRIFSRAASTPTSCPWLTRISLIVNAPPRQTTRFVADARAAPTPDALRPARSQSPLARRYDRPMPRPSLVWAALAALAPIACGDAGAPGTATEVTGTSTGPATTGDPGTTTGAPTTGMTGTSATGTDTTSPTTSTTTTTTGETTAVSATTLDTTTLDTTTTTGTTGDTDTDTDTGPDPECTVLMQGQTDPPVPSGWVKCGDKLPHRVEAEVCLVPAPPSTCLLNDPMQPCQTNDDCTELPFGSCQQFNVGFEAHKLISEYIQAQWRSVLQIGVPDGFVEHGSREDNLAAAGLDASSLRVAIDRFWKAENPARARPAG